MGFCPSRAHSVILWSSSKKRPVSFANIGSGESSNWHRRILMNPARCSSADMESMRAAIDRRRLREEACQNVVADGEVLLMKRSMRDARHHHKLLVRVRQLLEKLQQILQAGDSIV